MTKTWLPWMAILGGLTAIFVISSTSVSAQQHPNQIAGLSPQGSYASGQVDHVNLFSGALNLAIPLGQRYPLSPSGSDYGFTLTYSSASLWEFSVDRSNVVCQERPNLDPDRGANAGLGWTLNPGRLLESLDIGSVSPTPTYLSPTGSRHTFFPTLHDGESVTNGVYYSRDGSYLRLKHFGGDTYTLEHPNGLVQTFGTDGRLEEARDTFNNRFWIVYPDETGGVANQWVIHDNHGRHHEVVFETSSAVAGFYASRGGVVKELRVERFRQNPSQRQVATYRFGYSRQTAMRPPAHQVWCVGSNDHPRPVDVPYLTSVELPDGSKYEIPAAAYDDPGDLHDGTLGELRLPTRGTLEWDYGSYVFPRESAGSRCYEWFNFTYGVVARRMRDRSGGLLGTWTYAQDNITPSVGSCSGGVPPSLPSHVATTMTDALGHRTKAYFSVTGREEYGLPYAPDRPDPAGGGRFLSQEIFNVGQSQPLRQVYVRYEWDKVPFALTREENQLNQRRAEARTLFNQDSGNWTLLENEDFDGVGHYRVTKRSGSWGTTTKETRVHFNPGRKVYNHLGASSNYQPLASGSPWLLTTYSKVVTKEGSSKTKLATCFDSTTGFLYRTRTYETIGGISGALPESSDDVVADFGPAFGGGVATERLFGGDGGGLSLSGELCSLPLPSQDQYRVSHTYEYGVRKSSQTQTAVGGNLPFKSLDLEIDGGTGLARSSREPSGLQTTYSYDSLSRLTRATPQVGHGAPTEITYLTPSALVAASVFSRQVSPDNPNGVLTEFISTFDDFGRLWQEYRQMPGSTPTARRVLRYNANGWLESESTWGSTSTLDPWNDSQISFSTVYRFQDALGRPGAIDPPDGQAHRITLQYEGARAVRSELPIATGRTAGGQILETPSTREEVYDPFGRLTQVREPTGVSGGLESTFYGYDLQDRLVSVSQGIQQRSFVYDGRGFLLRELHPEIGATPSGDDWTYYGAFDARGLAGFSSVGSPSQPQLYTRLGYSYDRAGRITQVREESAGNRSLKEFVYDASATAGAWAKGQLVTAVRHNYATAPVCGETVVHDVHVTETYTYNGRAGGVSSKTTRIASGANEGHTFAQSWSYDNLGNPSQLTYPACTHAECSGTLPGSRVQTFGYDQGFLTSVTGFAPSITYHSNGVVATVGHGNSVIYSVENDPFFQARPRSISTSGGNRNWNSGTYRYDGAGNIAEMGNDYFLYDAASRVKEAKVIDANFQGGAERSQRYTHDRYGNITQVDTREGGSAWETRTYMTNAGTNRLSTSVYDERGNQLTQPGTSFAYDGIGMLTRQVGSGNDNYFVYNVDDERVWTLQWDPVGCFPASEQIFSLRDLDGKVLREFLLTNNAWTVEKDYIYRGSQLLASVNGLNQTAHYHPDHLGTPRLITGDPGATSGTAFLLGRHNYFPFGEEATSASQNTFKMRFTGHERDLNQSGSADDLDYMHARHYRPMAGKFLSTDPGGAGSSTRAPQSWNRYAYVMGNPVSYTDPTGRFAILAIAAANFLEAFSFNDSVNAYGSLFTLDPLSLPRLDANDLLSLPAGIGNLNITTHDPVPPGEFDGCSVFDSFGRCLTKCAAHQVGLDTLVGAGAVAAGQPIIPKRFASPGASRKTSLASKYLSKMFPQKLPFRIRVPTAASRKARTRVAGRVAGRLVPYVGWALLAKDGIETLNCVSD